MQFPASGIFLLCAICQIILVLCSRGSSSVCIQSMGRPPKTTFLEIAVPLPLPIFACHGQPAGEILVPSSHEETVRVKQTTAHNKGMHTSFPCFLNKKGNCYYPWLKSLKKGFQWLRNGAPPAFTTPQGCWCPHSPWSSATACQ